MNSSTAVLFISAIMYTINGFFIDFVPHSMIPYELVRNTNYFFGRVSNINIELIPAVCSESSCTIV